MRAADAEVLEIAVAIVVEVGALRALFAWDERRMTDAQKERAWRPATRGMVVASPLFFPLWLVGVPLHFVRTRRSLRGVAEGVVWLVAVYAAAALVDVGLALALGVE